MSILGTLVGLGTSILGSKSNSKSIAEQGRLATENAARNADLVNRNYDRSATALSQWTGSGAGANSLLASRFGVPTSQGAGATGQSGAGSFNAQAYLQAYPDVAAEYSKVNGPGLAEGLGLPAGSTVTPEQFAAWHYQSGGGQQEGRSSFETPAGSASGAGEVAASGPMTIGSQQVDQYGAITAPRDTYTRTDMARPDAGQLDVSLGSYQQSPDFQFQMDRGMNALQSNKTMSGLLRSGAAMKGALDFSQNLAMGDYNQWRNYATNQYNTNRNVLNQNFQSDRGFANDAFAADRAYGNSTYESDRNYATGRYDQNTNNLFDLSQQGLNATGSLVNAGTQATTALVGGNNALANTQSGLSATSANNRNSLLSNFAGAYGAIESDIGKAISGLGGGSKSGGGSGGAGTSSYLSNAASNYLARA